MDSKLIEDPEEAEAIAKKKIKITPYHNQSNKLKESNEKPASENNSSNPTSLNHNKSKINQTVTNNQPNSTPPVNRFNPFINGCRSVHSFARLNTIDEGSYGVVHRARDIQTGEICALKKIKMDYAKTAGFPVTSLREINILLALKDPNIVELKEIVVGRPVTDKSNNSGNPAYVGPPNGIYMVMEYLEHDVKALMKSLKQPFRIPEIKCLMKQLLSGVATMHDNWILHRDLKTSNLLMSNKGILKICDFGLARRYSDPIEPYTPLVVTLWYRAPELLLGATTYTTAIDIWSVGCIFGEFLLNAPLISGKGELDQVSKIFKLLGTPNEKDWPEFYTLPLVKSFQIKKQISTLRETFPRISFTNSSNPLSDQGFDLLSKLLTLNPQKRISAREALNHPWFSEAPRPQTTDMMPTWPPTQAKKEKSEVELDYNFQNKNNESSRENLNSPSDDDIL